MIYASSVYWISTVLQPCDFNLILSMPLPLARRTNFISSCFTFPWDHWCSSLYTHSLELFHKPQFTPKPIYLFSMYHFSLAWQFSLVFKNAAMSITFPSLFLLFYSVLQSISLSLAPEQCPTQAAFLFFSYTTHSQEKAPEMLLYLQ